MQHCTQCKIDVEGNQPACPLCQGTLSGQGVAGSETFPHIKNVTFKNNIYLKTICFTADMFIVLGFVLAYLFHLPMYWVILLALGIASLLLSVSVGYRKRKHLPKNILLQTLIFITASVGLDIMTGWHRWSVNYAVPVFIIVAMLSLWLFARFMKIRIEDFLVYMLLDILLSLVPLATILFDIASTPIFPAISIGVSVLSFTALFIFKYDTLKAEFQKRFHV